MPGYPGMVQIIGLAYTRNMIRIKNNTQIAERIFTLHVSADEMIDNDDNLT